MTRADIPFEQRLDAEHAAVLDLIPPGMIDLRDVPRTRAMAEAMLKAAASRATPVAGVTVQDHMVPGEDDRRALLLRLYTPAGADRPGPAMLYMHGGGFVLGTVEQFDAQCRQMAADSGVTIASIEYRRAPEHPYPAPLEDCHAALAWLHGEADALGLDPARIGIGGTSAGAGLAAGLALLARDRESCPVAFQVLEAPMLDHRCIAPSSHAVDHPKVWNRAANLAAWALYLGDHARGEVAGYASPAIAQDLVGLPPAYVCIAAHDLFLDEAFDYARRLLEAGVPCEFHAYPMGFHGSPRMLPVAPASQRWKVDLACALRRLARQAPIKDRARRRVRSAG